MACKANFLPAVRVQQEKKTKGGGFSPFSRKAERCFCGPPFEGYHSILYFLGETVASENFRIKIAANKVSSTGKC